MTAAERTLKLVNDAQAKTFEPKSVECAVCGTSVKLEGEGDYNLTRWEEHKAECAALRYIPNLTHAQFVLNTRPYRVASESSMTFSEHPFPPIDPPQTSPPPSPTPAPEPAPTDMDCMTDAEPPSPLKRQPALSSADYMAPPSSPLKRPVPSPLKRAHDADDLAVRPAQRARTEGFAPPKGDVTWVDWALLPFRTFVQGFREGRNGRSVADMVADMDTRK